jgi:hypothetical protein|tara:strand:- start:440 stop:742 length:303 start_codon:yes stop_codon:yes gene_type:complete
MKLEIKDNCPLNNFKPCKKFDCNWFIQVRGTNPQTGKEQDEYGCAISYLPLLMIENSQQTRQTGSAIESFRNEMVQANLNSMKVLLGNKVMQKVEKKDNI